MTPGAVIHAEETVSDTDGSGCSFVISGKVSDSYDNASGTLSLETGESNTTLRVSTLSGDCGGPVADGDLIAFEHQLTTDPQEEPITTTSND